MNAERNYLMGLLAVRHKKASPDDVAALSAKAPGTDLGDSLLAAGHLTQDDLDSLTGQVDEALKTYSGNAGAAATALGVTPEEAHTLSESLLDSSTAQTFVTGEDSATAQTVVTDDNASHAATVVTSEDASHAATVVTDDMRSDAATVMTDDVNTAAQTVAGSGPPPAYHTDGVVPAVEEHAGRYDTLRTFAAGGMGKILLVHDKHLGRDIALKTLLPERLPGGTFFTRTGVPTMELLTVPIIARFLQEAHITGQLEHPSIVPVYELGYRKDGSLYYTMKLVRGKTMQEAIKEAEDIHGRLKLLTHFLNMCQAIAYAHSRGVIHRDLKPLNVMIGEFGETVLLDWGIAKVKGQQDIHAKGISETVRTMRLSDAEATAKTMYGQTIGSPYYMPPEQAAGELDKVGECADIYSLGAVLYHILAGEPPYKGNNVRQFMEKVKSFDPKPIAETEPAAPPELIAVVERAMQRKPEDRYASARELAEEVEQFISGGLVSAYDYNLGELVKRFVKKHWKVLSTAAAGLIALLAFGVYYNIRVTEERNAAIEAREAEEEQRRIAEEQEAIAVEQRDKAQSELYFASVALSQRSMDEQLMEKARAQLETAPAEYRQWEWGHLQHEANADLLTLNTGGRYVRFQGDTLIAGRANGTVESWNLAEGARTTTFIEKAGFGYALDHDEANKLLAVSGDKDVTVWDAVNGTVLFRHEETNPQSIPRVVSLDRAGKRVAALNADRKIRVWSLADGAERFSLPLENMNGVHVKLSPSGAKLLVARSRFGAEGFENTFAVYNVDDGAVVGEQVIEAPNALKASAFSPDGTLIALGLDNSLVVWNVEPWSERFALPGRYAFPGTVAFSPDGRWLAGGTRDGGLGMWRATDGEGTYRESSHLAQIRSLAFAPDSGTLASVSADRTARLWQSAGLVPLKTFRGHDATLFNVAFSAKGTRLATTDFDGEAKIWDLEATADWTLAEVVAYQPDAGLLAGTLEGADTVQVWDAATGHELRTLTGMTAATELTFDTGSTRLAGLAEGAVAVWDAATGETIGSWQVNPGASAVRFAGGGDLVSIQNGTTLTVHAVADGAEQWRLSDVAAWAVTEAGDRLAAVKKTEEGYRMHLGGVDTAPTGEGVPLPSDFPSLYLAFSSHGHWLFAGGVQRMGEDNEAFLLVLAADSGAEQARLTGHQQSVTATALSHDGTLLATGSKDNTIQVWSTADWQPTGTLTGHADNINDIAFAPKGHRIVSASEDGTFKIWDVRAEREIMTLQDAALAGEGAAASPREVLFNATGDLLFTRTEPALQPIVLRAFPSDADVYAGAPDATLTQRVRTWKRAHHSVPPSP